MNAANAANAATAADAADAASSPSLGAAAEVRYPASPAEGLSRPLGGGGPGSPDLAERPGLSPAREWLASALDLDDFDRLVADKVEHVLRTAEQEHGLQLGNGATLRLNGQDFGPSFDAVRAGTLDRLERAALAGHHLTEHGDPSPRKLLEAMRLAQGYSEGDKRDPAAAYVFTLAGYALTDILTAEARAQEQALTRYDQRRHGDYVLASPDFADAYVEREEQLDKLAAVLADPDALARYAAEADLDPAQAEAILAELIASGEIEPVGAKPRKPAKAHKAPAAFDYIVERFDIETALEVAETNPLAICGRRSRFVDRHQDPFDDPDLEGVAGHSSGAHAHGRARKAAESLGLDPKPFGAAACPECGPYNRERKRRQRAARTRR